MSSPHLVRLHGNVHHLMVNDEPFFIRGGEIQNSSFSSVEHMEPIWAQLTANNLNTVLVSVGWDQIEPTEGQFDFEWLDQQVKAARQHGLKLILLWFGSHKNGMCHQLQTFSFGEQLAVGIFEAHNFIGMGIYAPQWVKRDHRRFPRAQVLVEGTPTMITTLSVFNRETVDADAKAFATLMEHLKDLDGEHHTVIMVQVENEVGLMGDTRDRTEQAELVFRQNVPEAFLNTLKNEWPNLSESLLYNFAHIADSSTLQAGRSWEETFGRGDVTDELFMAFHYATYCEHVAKIGKAKYSLPLFTNVALRNKTLGEGGVAQDQPSDGLAGGPSPGSYPCGGPVETVIDIWQLFAPTLEFFAPDIYLTNYPETCKLYSHRDQPLFIPEQRRDEYGALRIWEAIGTFGAIATSPFAIDGDDPKTSPFTFHYELLRRFSGVILNARTRHYPMYGFFFDRFSRPNPDPSPSRTVDMGDWTLSIERNYAWGAPDPAFGIVIQTSSDTFLLLGEGYGVTFAPRRGSPASPFTGLLSFLEKQVVNEKTGELRTLRILNGDEVRNRDTATMPSTAPDLGSFCIASCIPAKTRIAEVIVFSLK